MVVVLGVRECLIPVPVIEGGWLHVLVGVQVGERGHGARVVRRVVAERRRGQVVEDAGVVDARLGAGELRRHQTHAPRRRDGRLVAEQHLVAHREVARLQVREQVAVVHRRRRSRRRRQPAVIPQAIVAAVKKKKHSNKHQLLQQYIH